MVGRKTFVGYKNDIGIGVLIKKFSGRELARANFQNVYPWRWKFFGVIVHLADNDITRVNSNRNPNTLVTGDILTLS